MTEVHLQMCVFCGTVSAMLTRASSFPKKCAVCGETRDHKPVSYNRLSHQFQVPSETPALSPLAEDARGSDPAWRA